MSTGKGTGTLALALATSLILEPSSSFVKSQEKHPRGLAGAPSLSVC